MAEAYFTRAYYYYANGNTEQAIKEFDKAINYNPNYSDAYWYKAYSIYLWDLKYADYVKALEYLHKAASMNHGRELPAILRTLGWAYFFNAGFVEKGKYYYTEAFKLDGDTSLHLQALGGIEIELGNFEKGIELSKKSYAMDSTSIDHNNTLANQYFYHGLYKEALKYYLRYSEMLKSVGGFPSDVERQIGYAYLKNGNKKEADYWFNEQRKLSEESIKLGRNYTTSSYGGYYDLASLYAFMGEKEKAYKMLRIINNYPIFPLIMVNDIKKYNPFFKSISQEPEFLQIVRDMESKYQAEHDRVRKWLEVKGEL